MSYLREMIEAVKKANEKVLEIYNSSFNIEYKADKSPVTDADFASDKIIRDTLKSAIDVGYLSEEEEDDLSRLNKEAIFIVDPLDGTQDFVNHDSSFGINLALVINHEPVLAVIGLPVEKAICYAEKEKGTRYIDKDGRESELHVSDRVKDLIFLASKTHELEEEKEVYLKHADLIKDVKRYGASTKAVLLAAGKADASIRFTSYTKEWDVCAPDLVVREAGGIFLDTELKPFVYNRKDVYNHLGYCMFNRKENERLLEGVRRPF